MGGVLTLSVLLGQTRITLFPSVTYMASLNGARLRVPVRNLLTRPSAMSWFYLTAYPRDFSVSTCTYLGAAFPPTHPALIGSDPPRLHDRANRILTCYSCIGTVFSRLVRQAYYFSWNSLHDVLFKWRTIREWRGGGESGGIFFSIDCIYLVVNSLLSQHKSITLPCKLFFLNY